jgi:orotate phosphoribosyltransferase
VALVTLNVAAYQAEECPLCQQGIRLVKPGSRPA